MAEPETTTAGEEHRYHYYTGSTIPWFVHLLWVLFWCVAVVYVVRFLVPALEAELLAPP
jgi:hypothetical protein